MKKFLFSALAIIIYIIAMTHNVVAQQKELCMMIITQNDTIYIPIKERPIMNLMMHEVVMPKIIHDTIFIHDTVFVEKPVDSSKVLLDSLKKCLMSGPWYFSKREYYDQNNGTWVNDYSFSKNNYDVYTSDSTFTYYADGSLKLKDSYYINKDGKSFVQSSMTIQFLEITKDKLVLSYDSGGYVRCTQTHKILP
jgi:hypothetical protein